MSSLGGETLAFISVSPEGIIGDRRFALFDPNTGLAAAPEKETRWRPALFITASQPPSGLPVLRFADGAEHSLDDGALPDRLAEHFGFAVSVGLVGAGDHRFPVVSNRYKAAPLHLVTTASAEALAAVTGLPPLDARRFRPSVLIETDDGEGFIENDWVGHTLRIGDADIRVTEASRRCGMTLVAQPGLAEEPDVLRGIMRHNKRNLGVYATPAEPVTIRVGDPVYAQI
ncbi:MOSC domain-containing protein [Shinella sp. WSJ-2]|uniref:MOSC domain-containing protein n=1 Tax=Shinella sp. WSJ-2 TaxID=2303749 RepID=UPI001313F2F3